MRVFYNVSFCGLLLCSLIATPESKSLDFKVTGLSTVSKVGQAIDNGANVRAFTHIWTSQTSSKPWSLLKRIQPEEGLIFEVRSHDYLASRSKVDRAEVFLAKSDRFHEIPFDTWITVSGSVAVQSDNAPNSSFPAIIAQVHSTPDPGEMSPSPPLALRLIGNDLALTVQGDLRARSIKNSMQKKICAVRSLKRTLLNQRPVFNSFVIAMFFSRKSAGAVRFSWNGMHVCSKYNLLMGYNDATGGYWKMGIYRPRPSPDTLRVIHIQTRFTYNQVY